MYFYFKSLRIKTPNVDKLVFCGKKYHNNKAAGWASSRPQGS